MGAGGRVNSQLCRASIAGGGAAPPVQRSRQVPPRALRACHLRRQGALGAARGAGWGGGGGSTAAQTSSSGRCGRVARRPRRRDTLCGLGVAGVAATTYASRTGAGCSAWAWRMSVASAGVRRALGPTPSPTRRLPPWGKSVRHEAVPKDSNKLQRGALTNVRGHGVKSYLSVTPHHLFKVKSERSG